MRPPDTSFVLDDLSECALLDVVCMDHTDSVLCQTTSLKEVDAEIPDDDEQRAKHALVLCFATTSKGHSIALTVHGYRPSFTFEVPDGLDYKDMFLKMGPLAEGLQFKENRLKRFQGQVPSKENPLEPAKFRYVTVSTDSYSKRSILKNRFQKYVLNHTGQVITYVNESIKDATQFCNDLGLTMSGWFSCTSSKISRRSTDSGWSTCQIEIETFTTRIKPLDKPDLPPWIACSFDCEMMSHDGLFPNVTKGDFTVCLCATVWRTDQESTFERHVFALADKVSLEDRLKIGRIEDLDLKVHQAKNSADLIEQFRDFLVEVDVDILTGWNIYGFDFPFLYEDWSSYFKMCLERCTQGFAQKMYLYVNHHERPSTIDLINLARSRKLFTQVSSILKNQKHLPKDPMEWPESVAMVIRDELLKVLKLDRSEMGPPGRNPTKEDLVRFSKDATIDMELRNLAKNLLFDSRSENDNRGLYWGRIRTEPSHLEIRQMASAAKGDNTYSIWSCTGRVPVDLMQIIKDDKKPDENNLRFAAETWLDKDSLKKDLTPQEMFDNQSCGNVDSLNVLIDQCARDADIPMRLIQKLSYVPTWVEMSRVTFTSLSQVLNGGQQRKVFNVIARFVHNEYAINVLPSGWPLEPDFVDEDPLSKRKPDQQGATVIEPEPGHQETPVSVLDFESLQPSIIIFFNLCASSLILNLNELSKEILESPGFVYETHAIEHNILDDPKLMTYISKTHQYTFVKHQSGVLPRLLRHLLKSRKGVKAIMAAETDAFKKAVLNGRQNGLKIVCNSVYGFCGVSASKGLLPCKPVAAVTTLKGRSFIDAAKNYVEDHYKGSKVLQGDSVTGDTVVMIRDKSALKPLFVTIEELCFLRGTPHWQLWHNTKECMSLEHLQIWSDKGFVDCPRLIRHETDEYIYRVISSRGIVDATGHHSMIRDDGMLLDVDECKPGTPMLSMKNLCGRDFISPLNMLPYQSSNSSRPHDVFQRVRTKLECAWVIHDFQVCGYSLHDILEEFQDEVFSNEIIFVLHFSLAKPIRENSIVKVRLLGTTSKYVYDLQTANHHFAVMPGELVVHNTDSIMIRWHMKNSEEPFTIPEAQALGEEASKAITVRLREGRAALVTMPVLEESRTAVTLANEKVQCPYLLIKKKNQAGIKWTPSKAGYLKVPGFGFELDMKGIDAVRRDRTKFVRELSEQLLNVLLIDNNAKGSLDVLSAKIQDLLHDRVPISDFVLSKSLKGSYASENVPHVQAWRRMQARGDAGCPSKGGRMPILIVEPQGEFARTSASKVPLQQRAEHPSFVENSKGAIKICKKQYLEGIQETMERLQSPTRWASSIKALFENALDQASFVASRNTTLKNFCVSDENEVIVASKEPSKKKLKKEVQSSSLAFFAKK